MFDPQHRVIAVVGVDEAIIGQGLWDQEVRASLQEANLHAREQLWVRESNRVPARVQLCVRESTIRIQARVHTCDAMMSLSACSEAIMTGTCILLNCVWNRFAKVRGK